MLFGGFGIMKTASFSMSKNIFEIIRNWGYEPTQFILAICAVCLIILVLRGKRK